MKKVVILLSLVVIFLIACGDDGRKSVSHRRGIDPKKPMAWGKDYTIYVFADDEIWNGIEGNMRKVLSDSMKNINNEHLFDIERADFKKMDMYYKYKNLIFLSDLESKQKISNYVKNKISLASLQQAKEKGYGYFKNDNLWANDQLVTFAVGKNNEILINMTEKILPNMLGFYKKKLFKRINNKLMAQNYRDSKTMRSFPINVPIPKTYLPYKESKEERFATFYRRNRKNKYDRFFTVYYEKANSNPINEEWLIAKRNELGKNIYEGDVVSPIDLEVSISKFKKYNGLKLLGRWQNEKALAGGFFETFAYYIPEKKIVAIFDGYVYFPQGDKLPGLLELEVIAKTMKIK